MTSTATSRNRSGNADRPRTPLATFLNANAATSSCYDGPESSPEVKRSALKGILVTLYGRYERGRAGEMFD